MVHRGLRTFLSSHTVALKINPLLAASHHHFPSTAPHRIISTKMSQPPRVSSIVRRIELTHGSVGAQVTKPTHQRTQSAEMRPPPDQPNATWFHTLPSGPEHKSRQRADWKAEMEAERQERRLRVREARGNLKAEMAEEEQGRWAKQKGRIENFDEKRAETRNRRGNEAGPEADVMGFGRREMEMIKREDDDGNDLLARSATKRLVQEMVKREEWNEGFGDEPHNPFLVPKPLTRGFETQYNPASPVPKVESVPSTPNASPHRRTIRVKPEPASPSSRIPSPIAEAFYRTKTSPEHSTPEPISLHSLPDRNTKDFADMPSHLLTPQPKPKLEPPSPTTTTVAHHPIPKQEYYIPTGALPSSFPLPLRASCPSRTTKTPKEPPSSHTFERVASPLRHSVSYLDYDINHDLNHDLNLNRDHEQDQDRPKTQLSYLRPLTPTPFSTPYGLRNAGPYAAGLHCIPGSMLEQMKRRTRVPSRRVVVVLSQKKKKKKRGVSGAGAGVTWRKEKKNERRGKEKTCVWWKVPFCRCCVLKPEVRGKGKGRSGRVGVRLSILDGEVEGEEEDENDDDDGDDDEARDGFGGEGEGEDVVSAVVVGKKTKKRKWWHFRARKNGERRRGKGAKSTLVEQEEGGGRIGTVL